MDWRLAREDVGRVARKLRDGSAGAALTVVCATLLEGPGWSHVRSNGSTALVKYVSTAP